MGSNVVHVGASGMGNVFKLVNNAVGLTNVAVAAEGLNLGVQLGADFDSSFDSPIMVEDVRAFLRNSSKCFADLSLPNFGCIPQIGAIELGPESTAPLGDGNLTIPKTTLTTTFINQVVDQLITNSFASDSVSGWGINPLFTVTMTGPLTINEPGVIPDFPGPRSSVGGPTSFLTNGSGTSLGGIAATLGTSAVAADDVPAHPYKVAMEVASLAPNAEVTIYPWKDTQEHIDETVEHARRFLNKHEPIKV